MAISKRLLGLGASAAIIFAACGPGTSSQAPTGAAATQGASQAPATAGPTAAAIKYRACAAFDTGGLGDKSFNDLAQKGIFDAQALGYQTAEAEARTATDYSANLQRLLDAGCQTIIAVGFNQGAATAEKALANPTIGFAQVDTSWCGGPGAGKDFACGTADDLPIPPNYSGLDYHVDEAAMLAGYLAAGWSKTGKIGTYGGQPFAGVTRFMDGLYAGIQYYNKQKGTTVTLLGWDGDKNGAFVNGSNPWGDSAKGEQLAKTLLDQGVDVMLPVAGGTGNGSIKAMFEAGKWAIGVDTDQWISLGSSPYHAALLTSAQKNIDGSVVAVIEKNSGYGGTTPDLGGEDYSGTLANEGVLLAPYHDYDSQISAALKAEIETLRTAITNGTIKVCDYLKRGC